LFHSHGNILPNLSVAATGQGGPAHQKKAAVHPAICLIVSQQSILPPEKLSAALAVNRQPPIGQSKTSFKTPSAKTIVCEFRSASAYLASARNI
jgi:hypothetical protein